MLNAEVIDREILELEHHDTTYATCEKLAWLYIVRDHMNGSQQVQSKPVTTSGKSEFLNALNGKDSVNAWSIMDELMETLKAIYPKAYSRVMVKISELPTK